MGKNPFTPGLPAREVFGRQAQLADARETLMDTAKHESSASRIRVDVGQRGQGKTSLLRAVQRIAKEMNFATVCVTAGHEPLVAILADEIGQITESWGHGDLLAERVREVKVSAGVPGFAKLDLALGHKAPPTATRTFRTLVSTAASAARDERGLQGLVILVDEFQESDVESVRTICYAWQEIQDGPLAVPAVLMLTGLPLGIDGTLLEAVSFAERFTLRELSHLNRAETLEALSSPTSSLGVAWDTPTLEKVAEKTGGYPYFIQVFGYEMWRAGGSPDKGGRLTGDHLEIALPKITSETGRLYERRWRSLGPEDQEFIRAMASEHGGPVEIAKVRESFGGTVQEFTMLRNSLIARGIIERPEMGILASTIPGFCEYVESVIDG